MTPVSLEPGSTRSRLPTAGTYVGLFFVTASTLMYQIVLTRIFSVTMWYHFAFVAISLALFGLTAGALLVHLRPTWFPEDRVGSQLWVYTLLFGISIAVSIVIQLAIPVDPTFSSNGLLTVAATCVVIAVPFTLSGVVVCLSLTRFPEHVNRLYAADLIGGGLGCALLVYLLSKLDAPSLVVLTGAFAAVGAAAFARSARNRRGVVSSVVSTLLLIAIALLNNGIGADGEAILRIRYAKGVSESTHLAEHWNTFSRVTVDGIENADFPPFGWGMSSTLPPGQKTNQLGITIDSIAGTPLTRYRGNPDETTYLRYDVSNLVHYLRSDADVAIVGVGGGRDILSALQFDQRSITGIELNPTMLELLNDTYGDFTGHLDRNPKVTLVNDEARSFLARNDKKYDIIEMSMTDTSAAGSANAFALGENSLYTTEAWNLLLDRLEPDGILSATRWFTINGRPPLETYRAAVLAAQTLKDRGVKNPRDHMLIYKSPIGPNNSDVATLLVSKRAYSVRDLETIGTEVERLAFEPVLTPTVARNRRFAEIASPAGPGRAIDAFTEDISAPNDNRPFFFQMASLDNIFSGKSYADAATTLPVIQPVIVLFLLGGVVLALAALCIGLPLVIDRRRRTRRRGIAPFTTYFAGIGFGFLLVEVSQLQRLSVFLGQPVYSLAVVLFTLLVFSGFGSMITERVISPTRPSSFIPPLVALLVLAGAFGLATPAIISSAAGATTPARIAISIGLLAPMALAMGMPFTIGMRAANLSDDPPTAFLWGVNGATSVCASVVGLVISIFLGISFAFWSGTFAYATALVALIVIVRRSQNGRTALEPERNAATAAHDDEVLLPAKT